jgi:hypothetical protein
MRASATNATARATFMPERRGINRTIAGAILVIGVLAVLGYGGRDLLWSYGWVLFPGVFAVAIVARGVEEYGRRRQLRKFRAEIRRR